MQVRNLLIIVATLTVLTGSCGKKDNGENNTSNFSTSGSGGGLLVPTVNLRAAASLLVTDPSQKSTASLIEQHNDTAKKLGAPQLSLSDIDFSDLNLAEGTSSTDDGTNSLQKSDSSGNISSAISATTEETGNGPTPTLPKILTLALSPAPYNEVFVHFERSFRFKKADTSTTQVEGSDPRSDGTYCQLFRVKGGDIETLKSASPTADNLECLDANHFIDNWNAYRLSVFQFDSSGNVYFPGAIPNSQKLVVYKWDRTNGNLSEMINSNICVQDFLVMKSGSMFYTGTSSCNGMNGPNGGFFRYLNSSGLTEIARNWYNFIYEANTTTTGDQSVFFGPDPTASGTASWNSACLFKFDPNGGNTTAARTSKVITCGDNIWSWIQMTRSEDQTTYGKGFQDGNDASDAYKTEMSRRCTSSGQIFAGGGSQISSIKQDSSGQIYVIGNVRKKNAGTVTCSVEIRGPHCTDADGDPYPSKTTSSDCTNAGGTWVDEGNCNSFSGTTTPTTSSGCFTATGTWNRKSVFYSGVEGDICTTTGAITQSNWWSSDNTKSFQTASNSTTNTMKFRMNGMNCQPPNSTSNGDQWTSEYQGLGKVNSSTLTLSLLSGTSEQAINLWVIGDVVYYSAFNSTTGKYSLRTWDGTQSITMIDNFETYHLSASVDSTSLYYDGLDFSDNTYNFGTVLKASPYTRAKNVGLTGTLKMVVLLP